MAFLVIPDSDERALSSEKAGDYAETLSWKVLVDTPAPSLAAIQAAVGVYVGSAGANGTTCKQVRVRGGEDRYAYRVTADYSRLEKIDNPLSETDKFAWSTSISTSKPCTKALGKAEGDKTSAPDGTLWVVPVANSAGDPIEGVLQDVTEARLRITGNRAAFPSGLAMGYTGSVNKLSYAGAPPYTWKCMSIEASEQEARIDDGTGTGNTIKLLYWQVVVELAYRPEGWSSDPFDIGWNQVFKLPGGGQKKYKCTIPRTDNIPGWSDANDQQKYALIEQYAAHDMQALYSIDSSDAEERLHAGEQKQDFLPPDPRKFYTNVAKSWSGVFPQPPS